VVAIRFCGNDTAHPVEGAAVVVDVLRAFTTAAYAFAAGAGKILLAANDEAALTTKAAVRDSLAVKDGPPAAGFDFVNSPALISEADLRGRTLVQRTTNGTVGATAARGADLIVCTGFVCASATSRALLDRGVEQATFVITGHQGSAEEDLACAELIAAQLTGETPDPAPFLRRAARSSAAAELRDGVAKGHRGVHQRDIEMALEIDRFFFAMIAAEGPYGLALTTTTDDH